MKKVYTEEDIQTAYQVWANAPRNNRDHEWNLYLDLRDGVPVGTNEANRNKRFQRKHKEYKANKQDRAVFK